MWLAELSVSGFRNLASARLEFDPGVNVIFGPNGAGKTNLLEAIAILASGRSFRTLHDRELLGFGAAHFRVAGRARSEQGKEWSARVYYSPAERKRYFMDRREIPRRSLFAGWLPLSVFRLDDRRVVAGPAAERRAFLDDAVAKLSRPYRWMLTEFRKVLAQRNALLRRKGEESEFEVWEARLAELAREISSRRKDYWTRFKSQAERIGRSFMPKDELRLEYVLDVSDEDYPRLLRKMRSSELKLGITRHGPHRDDFRVLLNGRPLHLYGSCGEARLAALALTLAEAETLLASGRRPVYLMDDVAAELDDVNAGLLFRFVGSKGQLFYAAAHEPLFEGRRFNAEEGKVRQV